MPSARVVAYSSIREETTSARSARSASFPVARNARKNAKDATPSPAGTVPGSAANAIPEDGRANPRITHPILP